MKLHIPLLDGQALTFEGTHEELVAIAERFVRNHAPILAVGSVNPPVESRQSPSRRWTEQTAKRLWGLVYGDQAKLVKFLVERGGSATYEDLTKHMGFEGQHLSGILSPLTRNSQ